MKDIFGHEGLEALKAFRGSSPLFGLDFDGTLAPIVQDPARARITKNVAVALERLCASHAVAVVSGRSLADLRPRLPECVPYAIGNHGLEGLSRGTAALEMAQSTCVAWLQALLPELGTLQGVHCEDKGHTLSLHYRRSKSKSLARAELLRLISTLVPSPRPVLGKDVINLLPPGPANKGLSLLELMVHLHRETAIYVGDDDTDEDVFSIAGQRILGIRVGHKKSAARYYLPRQSDIGKLISLFMGD